MNYLGHPHGNIRTGGSGPNMGPLPHQHPTSVLPSYLLNPGSHLAFPGSAHYQSSTTRLGSAGVAGIPHTSSSLPYDEIAVIEELLHTSENARFLSSHASPTFVSSTADSASSFQYPSSIRKLPSSQDARRPHMPDLLGSTRMKVENGNVRDGSADEDEDEDDEEDGEREGNRLVVDEEAQSPRDDQAGPSTSARSVASVEVEGTKLRLRLAGAGGVGGMRPRKVVTRSMKERTMGGGGGGGGSMGIVDRHPKLGSGVLAVAHPNTRCTYCPKRFDTLEQLTEHVPNCVSARPHECAQCGKRFKHRAGLDQHARIHSNSRPYNCHFCEKTFIQKCHLDQHERIHTGAKPYVCSFCGRAFRQRSGQQQHEMTHLK